MNIACNPEFELSKVPPERWLGLTRSEVMLFMFAVAILNALAPAIVVGILRDGLVFSLLNTFEVSAIVWLSIFIVVRWVFTSANDTINLNDKTMAVVIVVLSTIPLGPAAWIVISGLAVFFIRNSKKGDNIRRSGWLILAITVPMFWSKPFFNFFSSFFLAVDAELVSLVIQTERTSNLVALPNGEGYLQIAAACSSVTNVSLAVLCWTLFCQVTNERWRPSILIWCVFSCLSVIAINVARISLIGFFPAKYELLHGPIGATTASWLTVMVVFSVCYYGVGRGRIQIV